MAVRPAPGGGQLSGSLRPVPWGRRTVLVRDFGATAMEIRGAPRRGWSLTKANRHLLRTVRLLGSATQRVGSTGPGECMPTTVADLDTTGRWPGTNDKRG